jgi:hypothetical protein
VETPVVQDSNKKVAVECYQQGTAKPPARVAQGASDALENRRDDLRA